VEGGQGGSSGCVEAQLVSDSANCHRCGARGDASCACPPADIRALADGLLEDQLAGLDFDEAVERVALFALAVLDALDERAAASATASDRYHDGFSSGVGMTWEARRLELEAIRAAIARNMEARRGS
jgi:hypothetical protein